MAELKNGWSFLKRSGGEEKKPSKYAKYEQNRGKRRFQESWKTGRPWLKVSAESMSCTWCTDVHEAPNEFCWTTAKVETLKSHESSKAHIKSVGVIKGRTLVAKGETTEAQKSIESLNKAVINKLSILFKTVHALCLAGRPFSDYVWMSKLDKAKGLDIGQTYLNSNSAKEFSKFIALTELNKIAQIIQSSKFVSILSDGSTDCSVTEVEIVYARICNAGEIKQ
ncbi:zinc finger protein 862-like [Mytilus trossulus]|uniref:zinc finger protein 862-like n=1 Tax=Mytilus trossulus TaxID=6551 RepID=UPI00300645CC